MIQDPDIFPKVFSQREKCAPYYDYSNIPNYVIALVILYYVYQHYYKIHLDQSFAIFIE